jgi:CheY-like chemotaxis protein
MSRRSRALILVVDDYADNREMYGEYFRHAGYDVELAGNGVEAVAKARELMPDVIIMDLSLPMLDGWEATHCLKTDPKTRDIWIVALTGHGEHHFVERARAAGADDFALKPLIPLDLTRLVKAHLSRRKRPTRLPPRR